MSKASPSYALAPSSLQDPMRFLFEGLEVRALDRRGKPWFVGKDVCQVLGHENSKQALSRLPGSERATIKIADALGREQPTTIISIAGVFRLAMTSRVDGAERFRAWLTDEVLPQIYTRGTYGTSTLATREADLSALTDAVSAIVPALTAITTTLAALSGRVTALEARPSAPALLTPEEIERRRAISEKRREAGRKGGLARAANQAAREAQLALPAPKGGQKGKPGPLDRPALPAPRLVDGLHPLRFGRVHIKDGAPFEVYSGPVVGADHIANVEAAFSAAFPGYHLGGDWRSARGWDYDWSKDAWPTGHEPAPADVGMVARARRGRVVDQPARVIDDEYGQPVAVEWKGQRSALELESMSAELRRLRYSAGPWRRVAGGYRAELH